MRETPTADRDRQIATKGGERVTVCCHGDSSDGFSPSLSPRLSLSVSFSVLSLTLHSAMPLDHLVSKRLSGFPSTARTSPRSQRGYDRKRSFHLASNDFSFSRTSASSVFALVCLLLILLRFVYPSTYSSTIKLKHKPLFNQSPISAWQLRSRS